MQLIFQKIWPQCRNNDNYIFFRWSLVSFFGGYVNLQNYRIWLTNNPHVFEETSLPPIKVGIWCAVSKHQVISPIFFDKTMDSDVCMKIVYFIALLKEDEWYAWFQQDGATAHIAEKMMDILANFFKDRIISEGRWSARCSDLTPSKLFMGVFKKYNVYWNKPSSTDKLKMEIGLSIKIPANDYLKIW